MMTPKTEEQLVDRVAKYLYETFPPPRQVVMPHPSWEDAWEGTRKRYRLAGMNVLDMVREED